MQARRFLLGLCNRSSIFPLRPQGRSVSRVRFSSNSIWPSRLVLLSGDVGFSASAIRVFSTDAGERRLSIGLALLLAATSTSVSFAAGGEKDPTTREKKKAITALETGTNGLCDTPVAWVKALRAAIDPQTDRAYQFSRIAELTGLGERTCQR
jgi:hypothetical protein